MKISLGQLKDMHGLGPVDVVTFEDIHSVDYFEGVGMLGLPIFQNLVLPELIHEGKIYEPITLQDVIITPTIQKNIVMTPVAGRNGTVKEYISNGDYQFVIQGALYTKVPNLPPIEDLRKLNEYLCLPISIPVTTGIFESLGVYNIVVTGISYPKGPGFVNIQPFEIQAISDLPIELELKMEE